MLGLLASALPLLCAILGCGCTPLTSRSVSLSRDPGDVPEPLKRFSPRSLCETRLCGARAGHSSPRSGRSFPPSARHTPLRLRYHPEEGADLSGEMPVATPRYVLTSGPGNRVCRASRSRFASRSRAFRMYPHGTTIFVKTTARGKCVLVTTSFRLARVVAHPVHTKVGHSQVPPLHWRESCS